ncbi:hypothetical protein B7463_g12463, partial [Scytalidium lignicola]
MDARAPAIITPPPSFDPLLCAFELQYLIGLENHQYARHLDPFTRSSVASITSFYPGRTIVTSEPEWSRNQHTFDEHLRLLSKALIDRALKPLDLPYVKLQEEEIKKIADACADEIKSRSENLQMF